MVWKPFVSAERVPAGPPDFHIKPLAVSEGKGRCAARRFPGISNRQGLPNWICPV